MSADPSTGGLDARGVEMSFGGVKAVDAVDIHLKPGVWTGLIGPNGSGKTTLLNILNGLYRPNAGTITLGGRTVTRMSPRRRSRHGIVRTFQHPQLASSLTLWENVLLGVDLRVRTIGRRVSRGEAVAEAARLLELFHCADYAHLQPEKIPYGLRKATELVRAVASKPAVLLLDEPAAGLSQEERQDLVTSLRKVQTEEPQLAVCLIEHDVRIVASLCPQVVALNFGRVVASGDVNEVLRDPDVKEAYLGKRAAEEEARHG